MFLSPLWLIIGAPALLLPILALTLWNDEPPPSMVEQAIGALPMPGNDNAGAAAPMGRQARNLPPDVSLSLYANSARADAMRQSKTAGSDGQDEGSDYFSREFNLLHPATLAREDLLVSDLSLLYSTPLNVDLGVVIFQEYCSARPGDPFYGVDINTLPLSLGLRTAIARAMASNSGVAVCGQFGR